MNWRPPDWEEIAEKASTFTCHFEEGSPPNIITFRQLFEAGADAIYESTYAKGRAEGIGNFLREFFCHCYPKLAGKLKF